MGTHISEISGDRWAMVHRARPIFSVIMFYLSHFLSLGI